MATISTGCHCSPARVHCLLDFHHRSSQHTDRTPLAYLIVFTSLSLSPFLYLTSIKQTAPLHPSMCLNNNNSNICCSPWNACQHKVHSLSFLLTHCHIDTYIPTPFTHKHSCTDFYHVTHQTDTPEMGILGLSKILYDKAPASIQEQDLKNYFGRRIAIDASMSIYQFIIAMKGFQDGQGVELTNEAGEVTSHINGLFARTLRMIDEGIKPIYVFDGKPPVLKQGELESRRQKASDAAKEFEKAKEEGNDELMEKMSKRTVRVSREQTDDCKKLLRLMGLPVVEAPTEAEAQCAELVKKGKAWAVGTEDMDVLTFGAPIMIRHLNFSDAKKRPIAEIHLDVALQQSGMTMDQFIDLCILLGCDYTPKIPGVGPHKAWEGIQKYGTIEDFVESLDQAKHPIPADFNFKEAREFFRHPEVTAGETIDIQFTEPDEEGLMTFLVKEKLFNPERVQKGIVRLKAALTKKTQGRLDQFFTIQRPVPKPTQQAGQKRPRSSDSAASVSGTLRKSTTGHKKAVKK